MIKRVLVAFGFLCLSGAASAQTVIAEGDVKISYAEMQAILEVTPPSIVKLAASDTGDRFELINQIMASRKLAAEADKLTPEDDGYWELAFSILFAKETYMFNRLVNETLVPPMAALAEERYQTQKDKYALVPETRGSSHILFASPPGLDREPLRAKAQGVLERLNAGEDFVALVQEYSDDKGSKQRDGSINRWITFGDPKITPPYSEALFALQAVGEYSDVVDSQFGLHIIRLDGIKPAYYREYAEVKVQIVNDLVREFRALTEKEIRGRFNVIDDDAFIDGAAMEEIFAPYR